MKKKMVLTPHEFNTQEAMAFALEKARNLLIGDLKTATPRDYRGEPDDDDAARRSRFAETILVDFWQVEAGGNPALGKTQERCAELLQQFGEARGRIEALIADWANAAGARPG